MFRGNQFYPTWDGSECNNDDEFHLQSVILKFT